MTKYKQEPTALTTEAPGEGAGAFAAASARRLSGNSKKNRRGAATSQQMDGSRASNTLRILTKAQAQAERWKVGGTRCKRDAAALLSGRLGERQSGRVCSPERKDHRKTRAEPGAPRRTPPLRAAGHRGPRNRTVQTCVGFHKTADFCEKVHFK